MKEIHDLKQLTVSSKREEKMIGFVGFSFTSDSNKPGKEGILKIAVSKRHIRRNYVTLTFIADTGDEEETNLYLKKLFADLREESLTQYLGPVMGALVKVPLDSFLNTSNFFMEELNIYLNLSEEPEQYFFEKKLIPGIGKILSFRFDAMEWFDTDKISQNARNLPDDRYILPSKEIHAFFQKFLGSGPR